MRKIYVLDTSVLLYDRCSIHSFHGNDVLLPVVTLDELDRFKDREGILGESARYVNRYLDGLRGRGKLSEGVHVEEHDVRIQIVDWGEDKGSQVGGFDMSKGDNRIILTAAIARTQFPDRIVAVVSKDINLRVKCDALGLAAQDYLRDRVVTDRESMYTGCVTLEVPPEVIDQFYAEGFLGAEWGGEGLLPNQLVVLQSEDGTNKGAICTTSCTSPTPSSKMRKGLREEWDTISNRSIDTIDNSSSTISKSKRSTSSSKSKDKDRDSLYSEINSNRSLSLIEEDTNSTHSYVGDLSIEKERDTSTSFTANPSEPLEDEEPSSFYAYRNNDNNIVSRAVTEGHRYLVPPHPGVADVYRVAPKSKEQRLALHLLNSPDISLVTLTGMAGSGKTYLALASALSGLYMKRYERIVVTRSIEPVGRDIGFLPGDIKEKMSPWMNPFIDNFRQLLRDTTMFDMMIQRGQIEISPVTFIRGRSISDAFLIVDEAQNLTVHELKTIITRVGKGSKVVLMGDTDQIDTPYIDSLSNGLTVTIERFKGHPMFGHVTLRSGERSDLATLAARIL